MSVRDPVTHLAAQHIQVGFRPDLGVHWLLCSRTPSGANLAELATCDADGDAVDTGIILTVTVLGRRFASSWC
jgi:hypothetical protein